MANSLSSQGSGWIWTCPCGTSGGGSEVSRELARAQFKDHRRTCVVARQNTQEDGGIMSTTAAENNAGAPPVAVRASRSGGKPPAAAAPKERKPRGRKITEEQGKAALLRLQAGTTTLKKESVRLGFDYNGPLRAVLRGLVGNDAYNKLMKGRTREKKAGGVAKTSAAKSKPKATAKKKPAAAAKKATAAAPAT